MRDDERGAVLRHLLERVLDVLLGVTVERGGRLVEHQDRRSFQDGAGDGDALLFATGKLQAALADLGFVALGRQADEIIDLREPRRLFDLGVAGFPAAVADVVADGVVEQHGVLRHHADGRAQRVLRDVADILAVDRNAPAADLVEAEQQARDGGFAGAGRTNHRHFAAGRDLEAEPFEDFPIGLVGEGDVLEADRTALDHERLGVRLVLDLRLAREDCEHPLDVDHRLLDLAIDHAHEVERLVELDHHGVDHHEVADGVGAGLDAVSAHHHHRGKPDREDNRLAGIEHGERDIGLDARLLVARHRAVVAGGFPLLGDEIFHRLVVEQRIDRLDVGVGVAVVHPAANVDAPLGRLVGERHVERDDGENDDDVAPVELVEQHDQDQRELDDRRHQLHDDHAHDGLDGVAAAFEHPRQAAGLALEMKAQRELVHVLERAVGEPPYRVHGNLGEDAVAHLREHRHQDARPAVGNGQHDRGGERPNEPRRGRDRRAPLPGQRVGCPLEGERHGDGDELGGEQEQHRHGDAQLEVAALRRPDIGPQPAHDGKQRAAAGGGHFAFQCFGRARIGIHSADWPGLTGRKRRPSNPSHIEIFQTAITPNEGHPTVHSLPLVPAEAGTRRSALDSRHKRVHARP